MTDMARYDPFWADYDDPFRGLFMRPVRLGFEGMPQLSIKADIKVTDDRYTLDAELPGVKKEDIHVSIDGNRVSISAEVRKEQEEKQNEQLLRSERYYGRLERSFALDSDIDEGKSQAKFSDGVLKLVLPKKALASVKRLSVS
jgi:HSP20 family protein